MLFRSNETKFASEAKKSFILGSKNGEVRAPALESTLSPNRQRWGCFIGILWAGRRRGRGSRDQDLCAGAASLRTVPPAAILNQGVECSCARPVELRCGCQRFTLGTLVRSARCEASIHGTLWASETRLSAKERIKRLDFIL